jgi:hypothetical protein
MIRKEIKVEKMSEKSSSALYRGKNFSRGKEHVRNTSIIIVTK